MDPIGRAHRIGGQIHAKGRSAEIARGEVLIGTREGEAEQVRWHINREQMETVTADEDPIFPAIDRQRLRLGIFKLGWQSHLRDRSRTDRSPTGQGRGG